MIEFQPGKPWSLINNSTLDQLSDVFPAVSKPTQFNVKDLHLPELMDEDGTPLVFNEFSNHIYEASKQVGKLLDEHLRRIAEALDISIEELAERFVLEVRHLDDIDVSTIGDNLGFFPSGANQLVYQLKYEYRLVPKKDI